MSGINRFTPKLFTREWQDYAIWFWEQGMNDHQIMTMPLSQLQLICQTWRQIIADQRTPQRLRLLIGQKIAIVQNKTFSRRKLPYYYLKEQRGRQSHTQHQDQSSQTKSSWWKNLSSMFSRSRPTVTGLQQQANLQESSTEFNKE